MIDAVLLDAGGVLLLPDPAVVLPPLHAAGVDPDAATLRRAHYAAVAAIDAAGHFDWDLWRRAYARVCGVPDDGVPAAAAALGEVFDATTWDHAAPDAACGLRALSATGARLGVVSNAAGTVEAMLTRVEVCQVGEGAGVPVEVVVDSHLVGVEKPDPAIFGFALDQLGLPAGRVAYVGDTCNADVAGAQAAGIRPLHLDPYGDCPRPGGHEHVRSLADAAGVVEQARVA